MIDKIILQDVLVQFGLKYWELMNVVSAFEKKETPDEDFFQCGIMPGRIFIEPTNNCNKHCVYCARDSMTRGTSMLTMTAFENIIKKIPRGLYLTMTGNGEPLLNVNIYEMIRKARDSGLLVGIITNGTLLTENNSRKLIEAGPNRVQISFDAVDETVYNAMYSKPTGALSYEKILSRILSFILLAKKTYKADIFITIASVLTEEVQKVRDKSFSYWSKLPIDNYYEGPLLSLQTNSTVAGNIGRETEEEWKICCNPWTSLKINADGTVNPCIQDFSSKYVIGDINEEPLERIVNSPKATALRKALFFRDIQFFKKIGYSCHECNAWQSNAMHDIKGYLENSYPITYGLMIREASKSVNGWGNKDILHLENEIRRLSSDE